MTLAMAKDRLEAEYSRFPLSAGRTAAERRAKALVESRLEEIRRRMNELRQEVRTLRPYRR